MNFKHVCNTFITILLWVLDFSFTKTDHAQFIFMTQHSCLIVDFHVNKSWSYTAPNVHFDSNNEYEARRTFSWFARYKLLMILHLHHTIAHSYAKPHCLLAIRALSIAFLPPQYIPTWWIHVERWKSDAGGEYPLCYLASLIT